MVGVEKLQRRTLLIASVLLFQGCVTTEELFAEYDENFCPITDDHSAVASGADKTIVPKVNIASIPKRKAVSLEKQQVAATAKPDVDSPASVDTTVSRTDSVASKNEEHVDTVPKPTFRQKIASLFRRKSDASPEQRIASTPAKKSVATQADDVDSIPRKPATAMPVESVATAIATYWNPVLYFKAGTDDLTDEGQANLVANVAQLKAMPGHKIFLRSLSAHKAGGEFNSNLYRKRIDAIKDALIKNHGIDCQQILEQLVSKEPSVAAANIAMVDVVLVDVDRRVGMQLLDARLVPVAFRVHKQVNSKPK